MYESFFGLRKRPFAAAPDAEVLVETPAVAETIARLDRCVRHGRGVGVMTAAAGMGKTHLCHRFIRRYSGEFRVALLPNAGFPTRRGFLQAILAELDHPYQKLGETELRLELTSVAKSANAQTAGVILLLDEAHRYSDRILDEVRLVANLIENGEPLIRVILAGQPELEDKLADPGLSGLNERVGELVSLPKLTSEESRTYLRERTAFAGGTLESLFDEASVSLLVRACGGIPRCLNQLADHSLLLGYVAERRPIDESLVREALDDLKRLPLQWHDPLPESVGNVVRSSSSSMTSHTSDDAATDDVIEIGGLMDEDFGSSDLEDVSDAITEPQPRLTPPMLRDRPHASGPSPAPPALVERPATEEVRDRFAKIDAAEARRQWFETLECSTNASRATAVIAGASVVCETISDNDLSDGMSSNDPDLAGAEAIEVASAAPAVATITPPARPAANPLDTLDRIEPLLAELQADFAGTPPVQTRTSRRIDGGIGKIAEGRIELERLVASLEKSGTSAAEPTRPKAHQPPAPVTQRPHPASGVRSTSFSDLRRRQRGVGSGGTE
ncbi:MAG: AAA family ATPase [Planctomycetaceae bacterium]|nr:AAA family ATPase [Planctomycetaceae bacterium]